MTWIAIDGNEANVAQRVGSNAYAFQLLVALEKLLREQSDVKVSVLLAQKPLADFPAARKGWEYAVFGPTALWTQYALPLHLFQHAHDYHVFYTPGHYAPRLSPVPYVSSVMDLGFLAYPRQFKRKDYLQLREWTRYSVRGARNIIAISEATKRDIVARYHVPAEKIVVAYPGEVVPAAGEVKAIAATTVLKKWQIHPPYILYVGTLQPRKNLVRLIEAFEKLVSDPAAKSVSPQLAELQLVLAGKVGWLSDEITAKAKTSKLAKRIILTGYVNDAEKVRLYQESVCTALVGLYEGFGIPALEALRYSSVPVVSRTTSLPEVVGKAGILVDPESTDSIVRGLQDVFRLTAKQHAQLLKEGRKQLKKFSWEVSAATILDTLLQVAK